MQLVEGECTFNILAPAMGLTSDVLDKFQNVRANSRFPTTDFTVEETFNAPIAGMRSTDLIRLFILVYCMVCSREEMMKTG